MKRLFGASFVLALLFSGSAFAGERSEPASEHAGSGGVQTFTNDSGQVGSSEDQGKPEESAGSKSDRRAAADKKSGDQHQNGGSHQGDRKPVKAGGDAGRRAEAVKPSAAKPSDSKPFGDSNASVSVRKSDRPSAKKAERKPVGPERMRDSKRP